MATADQRDPVLDGLFDELQRTASVTDAEHGDDGNGRLESAERVFTEIVGTHPEHAEAWNKRATVRFMRGNDTGSRSDIARVIALEPRHFGALSGLGMINMRRGDLAGALQAFEAALRVNPHMPQAEDMVASLRQRLSGRAL